MYEIQCADTKRALFVIYKKQEVKMTSSRSTVLSAAVDRLLNGAKP
jgi:hypothetical protein